jgi:hypothetical protein
LTIKDKTSNIWYYCKRKYCYNSFNVDRTKYDIKYGSGSFFDNLGDKAIWIWISCSLKVLIFFQNKYISPQQAIVGAFYCNQNSNLTKRLIF